MASAAAYTPPELFNDILWFILHEYYERTARRALSRCGQVCRHWARVCRPLLFRKIELHSANDLSSFKHILLTPPPLGLPSITEYVQDVTLNIGCAGYPWAHRIQSDCARFLSAYCAFNIRVDWWDEKQSSTARSAKAIFDTPPRALPHAYTRFSSLTLTNIRFQNAAELGRLLSRCHSLKILCLCVLTWDIALDTTDVTLASPIRALSYLRLVVITHSNEDKLLSIWLLPAFVQRSARVALPEQYFMLCRLLHLMGDMRKDVAGSLSSIKLNNRE
jgi:hypothetical protein